VTNLSVLTIGRIHAATIGGLLAAAFHDEPVIRWLVPDPGRRRDVMPRFFTEIALQAFTAGAVDILTDHNDRGLAVAVWFDRTTPSEKTTSGSVISSNDDADGGLEAIFMKEDADRWRLLDAVMSQRQPVFPHEYLMFAGVTPGHQGKGLGTHLLHAHHELLDAAGVPAYLEATSPASRALYSRLGYLDHHASAIRFPADGPAMWPMYRRPRAPGSPAGGGRR
jgi:GNAT superfamily N-acetyltransferase